MILLYIDGGEKLETELLVKKAQANDNEALQKLILDKKGEYYRLAYVYLDNKEDTLDAIEDMIVLVHENIKKLKNPDSFYSWSKSILINCCKKQLRRRKKIILLNMIEEEGQEYSDKSVESVDIKRYLKKLNSRQREAIKLRYFLDLDYQTIARITKVAEGTVKSRIHQGLKKLKKSMGGEYGGRL